MIPGVKYVLVLYFEKYVLIPQCTIGKNVSTFFTCVVQRFSNLTFHSLETLAKILLR